MLLPSPLPSEPFLPPIKPTRPLLPSFGAYQSTLSPQNALLASCRTLQNILESTPNLSCHTNTPPPLVRRGRKVSHHPLQSCAYNIETRKHSPLKPQPPRGANKRRRDEFENNSDEKMLSPSFDQENTPYCFSTPKRQRRTPLAMPLGLSARDFHLLDTPSPPSVDLEMPDRSSVDIQKDANILGEENNWTAADDRALVETVLDKLQLSKPEWNDCARLLGKDKDSLGRRWKMLVGDGDIGLRRGGKWTGRTDLDIRSW